MFNFFKRKPKPEPVESFEVRQRRLSAQLNARGTTSIPRSSSSSVNTATDDTLFLNTMAMNSYSQPAPTPSVSESCSSSSYTSSYSSSSSDSSYSSSYSDSSSSSSDSSSSSSCD